MRCLGGSLCLLRSKNQSMMDMCICMNFPLNPCLCAGMVCERIGVINTAFWFCLFTTHRADEQYNLLLQRPHLSIQIWWVLTRGMTPASRSEIASNIGARPIRCGWQRKSWRFVPMDLSTISISRRKWRSSTWSQLDHHLSPVSHQSGELKRWS